MWAVAYGEEDVVNVLLANPATNPNIVDDLGWNALMVAAWVGNVGAVRLLASKTTLSHKNLAGATALEVANMEDSPALALGSAKAVREQLAKYKSRGVFGRLLRTLRGKKGGRSKTNSKKRGTR